MEITVEAKGAKHRFRMDEDQARCVAPLTLSEWEAFRSENSRPVINLECVAVGEYDGASQFAESAAYAKSLEYFLDHRPQIMKGALEGVLSHVTELRDLFSADGDMEDLVEELDEILNKRDLRNAIGLSYVHLFPQTKDGIPYIGLEFECNWDPEHGAGVIFHGANPLASGQSGTARGIDFDVSSDGGAI